MDLDARSTQMWVEAQAAVQSDLDCEVLEEAAGLAQAELADVTFRGLLCDSVGRSVRLDVGGTTLCGTLTATSQVDDWLVLDRDKLLRVTAITRISGLIRICAPPASSGSANELRYLGKHWLRDNLGARIRIRISGSGQVLTGTLGEIGSDFISVRTEGGTEVISLGKIDSVQIDPVHIESVQVLL